MEYNEQQLDEVKQWLNDPDRDWDSDAILHEFEILEAIVIKGADPKQWFESLINWVLDAKAELEA